MKKYFLLITVWIGLFAASMFGAEPSLKPVGNRFLLVIETSGLSSRSAKAARETVRNLIETGFQAQIRPGDSMGLWTFNEQLYNSYPIQQWSPATGRQISERTDEFLKKVRFEKKSKLNVMMTPLELVVQASKALTVILISSGNEPIQGTPFDREINEVYSVYGRSLRDAKLPFVTVLVGRNGKLVSYAVNSALDAIQIPNLPLPTEPDLAQIKTNGLTATNKGAAATNLVTPPRRIAKSNIILTKPVVTNPLPTANIVVTNEAVNARVETTNSLIETISTNASPSEKVEALTANSVSTNTAQNILAPGLQPAILSNSTAIPVAPEKAAAPSLIKSPEAKINAPQTLIPAPQKVDPTTSVSRKPDGIVAGQIKLTTGNIGLADAKVAQDSPTNISSIPKAMVASEPLLKAKTFLFIGLSLLIFAAGLVFLFLRNSGSKSRPSLISRSMNQPPK